MIFLISAIIAIEPIALLITLRRIVAKMSIPNLGK
jgi:hypothetical protein